MLDRSDDSISDEDLRMDLDGEPTGLLFRFVAHFASLPPPADMIAVALVGQATVANLTVCSNTDPACCCHHSVATYLPTCWEIDQRATS